MSGRGTGKRLTRGSLMTAAVALALVAPTVASAGTVVEELDGPRGLAVGPAGSVVFAEADGTFSQLSTKGKAAGTVTELGQVPSNYIAPALAVGGRGQTFIQVAGNPPGAPTNPDAGKLYRWTPSGSLRVVANIAEYQETDHDPYNLGDPPEESNPFGVAALPDGSALVSDAAGNDLLRVFPDGSIVTVARLKPRMVEAPPFLGAPPGTMMPAEAVATSVTVGADGYYYVGELRGFPATPGTSQVWRIAPDSVGAVCDPEAPDTGDCRRYADGFTSIVDLGAGPDGSIYVVELAKASWFGWEVLGQSPVGSLFRLAPGGGSRTELMAGELVLPGGVDVGDDGLVYVSNPVFGPGVITSVGD